MDKYIDIIRKRKEASVSDKSVPAKKFKKASSRQYDCHATISILSNKDIAPF